MLNNLAYFENGCDFGYRGMMGYGGGFGFMIVGLIAFVLFIVAVVFAIRMAMHYTHPKAQETVNAVDTKAEALKLLNERYAKGELSDEDYTRMKENLEGGGK